MSFSTTTRQSLGILAAACLLSVALPAGTAMAQKVKNKGTTAETTAPAAQSEFSVVIPTIDATDSNVDDETLLAIFSGNITDNADALAGLTATSISIPEITLEATTTMDGEVRHSTVTFSDLLLSDVTDGSAASVSLTGMSVDAGDAGSAEFGAISASSFNIGGVLGLYGLVDAGGQTELETIYTDFTFEGGTFESPDISCNMGSMSAAEFKARPLNHSLTEMIALAEQLETADDQEPSPEVIGAALRMYADMFTAFETSPAEFAGFDCAGTDEEGRALSFTVAGMSMGGMSPGIYPSITVDGLDVTVEGDGSVQMGNFTMKAIDLSGPIAAILAAPKAIDESWFVANARALIPAFGGFSVSDIAVDVPDMENPDARINASIGAFDLSLAQYFNGIPTDVQLSASDLVLDVPPDSKDEEFAQLAALGITSINTGFALDASWNEADNTIAIDELSLTGVDLATIALTGTITNATEALFGVDEDVAMAAAMGVAVKQLNLDITDAGLADIILARVAADQGSDAATMRPVYASLAQGSILGLLAGAAEAQQVGSAFNAFISGTAKHLSIGLTAKEEPGLGVMDFMAAESDPTSLIGKVTIDATAE